MQQREAQGRRAGSMVGYNPRQDMATARSNAARNARASSITPGVANIISDFRAAGGGSATPQKEDRGFIGSILNSTIGSGIVNVLDKLDYMRRGVTLGVEELYEGVSGQELDQDDTRSNMEKLKDPTYGVGQLLGDVTFDDSLGNFFDKGVGFAGDVALDPLTYLTLGVGKAAGLGGRTAAATRLLEAGGSAADATKIGRYGVSHVDDAARKLAMGGDAGHGIRFMGKRIAGTGKPAQAIGKKFSGGRVAISDKLPTALRERGFAKELAPMLRQIQRGTGNIEDNLAIVSGAATQKAGMNATVATHRVQANNLGKKSYKSGDDRNVMHAIEMEDPSLVSDVSLIDDATRFFDDTYEALTKHAGTVKGADGVDVPTIQKTKNFVPHEKTPEYQTLVRKDKDLADIFTTKVGGEATGTAKNRAIVDGTKLYNPKNGVKVTFQADTPSGTVSLAQKNAKYKELLGTDKDMFHMELSKATHAHLGSVGKNVGAMRANRRIGEIAGLRHADAFVDEVDTKATKAGKNKGEAHLQDVRRQAGKQQAAAANDVAKIGKQVKHQLKIGRNRQVREVEKRLEKLKVFTKEADKAKTAAAKEIEAINAQQLLGKRAQDAVRKRSLRARAAGQEGPIPGGQGSYSPSTEAAREARANVGTQLDNHLADINRRADAATNPRHAAERKLQEDYRLINDGKMAQAERYTDVFAARAEAEKTLKALRIARGKTKSMTTRAGKNTSQRYKEIEQNLQSTIDDVGTYIGSDVTAKLMNDYAAGVARIERLEGSAAGLKALERGFKNGGALQVTKSVIRDGVDQLGATLLGDAAPHVRKTVVEQMNNLNKVLDDQAYFKALDTYTKFFKTYATMTPGFHVRNGMSATFMNAVDGVTPTDMIMGVRYWVKHHKNPKTWMDNVDWSKERYTRQQVEEAFDGVYGSGGGAGQFSGAEVADQVTAKGVRHQRPSNNSATRFSTQFGGGVEGGVRLGMALNSVKRGDKFDDVVARITRTHFDYSATSKLDDVAKRLIPFWTFLSRNVPLQLQQMVMKPKVYAWYGSLVRNMGNEHGDLIPERWRENSAFQINSTLFAQPDLPHIGIREDLEALTLGMSEAGLENGFTPDPTRLAASANPAIKIPFETQVSGKDTFTGREFRDDGFVDVSKSPDLQILAPLLGVLGLTDKAGADGSKTVVSEKTAHTLRGLIPLLGQGQRLGSGEDYYADRRNTKLMNYLGLPLKELNQAELDGEKKRKNFDRTPEDIEQTLQAALRAFTS